MADKSNRIMQSSVAYQLQEQAGAFAQKRLGASYDISSSKTGTFTFGDWARIGTDKGADALASNTTVAQILGVVGHESSGVIDETGYLGGTTGFYSNVPLLQQGLIYVPASGTVDLGDVPYLGIDPAKAGYGEIKAGIFDGGLDISDIAGVHKKSANGLVLINLNIHKN